MNSECCWPSHGRMEPARDLFLRSLAISENAATWRNLAVDLGTLGDSEQAVLQPPQRADELMNTRLGAITGSNLRWVDPETFARSVPPSEGLVPPFVPPPHGAGGDQRAAAEKADGPVALEVQTKQ